VACEDDRSWIRVSVRDTGIGISREKQDRLFKRFSQVDGSIGKEFGGTGLGLAISKRLVEAMGGQIRVSSQAGAGSTFSFDVPLAVPRDKATDALLPVERSPAANARILVADDTEMNQEITSAMLSSAGYEVNIAQDGAEAVRAASTGEYDLILMDVQMPGMDGLTATRRIREMGDVFRELPIIAITANVLPEQIGRCSENGMSDYLCKPYNRVALLQKVQAWLPAASLSNHSAAAGDVDKEPDSVDFDEPTYMEFRALAGASERVWLSRTRGDLADFQQRFRAEGPGLAEFAHRLASQMGMLGFAGLSTKLKDLEATIDVGADVTPISKDLNDAVEVAVSKVEQLLSAVPE
jgi:CheY-like chemotaxis protein